MAEAKIQTKPAGSKDEYGIYVVPVEFGEKEIKIGEPGVLATNGKFENVIIIKAYDGGKPDKQTEQSVGK